MHFFQWEVSTKPCIQKKSADPSILHLRSATTSSNNMLKPAHDSAYFNVR